MEVLITKNATVGVFKLKKGETHLVTNKKGAELIAKGVAKETSGEAERRTKVVKDLEAKANT